MLNICTKSKETEGKVLKFPDLIFENNLGTMQKAFNDVDAKCLKHIDGADAVKIKGVVLAKKHGHYYPLTDISTGAKTCILANHLPQQKGKLLSLNSCGDNALTALLRYVKDSPNDLYLSHCDFSLRDKTLADVHISVNGEPNRTVKELWEAVCLN